MTDGCTMKARQEGKAYPRTCPECKLGPCRYGLDAVTPEDVAKKFAEMGKCLADGIEWSAAFKQATESLGAYFEEAAAKHDRRVTELLEANNREVERRRAAEKRAEEALDAQMSEHIAETPADNRDFVAGYLGNFVARVKKRLEAPTEARPAGSFELTSDDKEGAANWLMVDMLRSEEGAAVTIPNDNYDFEGPGAVIVVSASWTNWADRRFDGDNVHACLKAAVAEMEKDPRP